MGERGPLLEGVERALAQELHDINLIMVDTNITTLSLPEEPKHKGKMSRNLVDRTPLKQLNTNRELSERDTKRKFQTLEEEGAAGWWGQEVGRFLRREICKGLSNFQPGWVSKVSIKAMVWNCRGLRSSLTVSQAKEICRLHSLNIDFMFGIKNPKKKT